MGKILVVAEKPSVARDIARVLHCPQKLEGAFAGDTHIVTYAFGHLLGLKNPDEIDEKYKAWRMDTLPILPKELPLKPLTGSREQLKILKNWFLSPEIDSLVCATDSGREGELIFRLIYDYVKCQKPVMRLWISSMTEEAILQGFKTLRPGAEYDNLFHSAKCRQEADWLVGMNGSRAYSVAYHARLSLGRVQTPTLALLVGREKAIKAFVPEGYYEVEATFDAGYKGTYQDNGQSRIADEAKAKAKAITEKVKGQRGVIEKITAKDKRVLPPLLYDLTELQRDCNKRFGFSAQKTLDVAQSLYERYKLLTYPRTDSRYLSHDLAPKLPALLKKMQFPPYDGFIAPLWQKPLPMGNRLIDDSKVSDHHAIIPTGVRPPADLPESEQKVFDLALRRFIAVFYPEQTLCETEILTRVAGETFFTRDTMELSPGFTVLYKDLEKENKHPPLPKLTEGQSVKVTAVKALQKETKPPSPYTEATLLSAMEQAGRQLEDEALKEQMKERGLGTPATRAAMIERLIEVGYVKRLKKALCPTEKGIALIDILPSEITSPEMTGQWELALSRIAKGQSEPARFIEGIERFVQFIVGSAKPKADVRFESMPSKFSLGVCPQCQTGQIRENTKAFYCTCWQKGCRFTVWKNAFSGQNAPLVDSKAMKALLTKGQIPFGQGQLILKDKQVYFEPQPPKIIS